MVSNDLEYTLVFVGFSLGLRWMSLFGGISNITPRQFEMIISSRFFCFKWDIYGGGMVPSHIQIITSHYKGPLNTVQVVHEQIWLRIAHSWTRVNGHIVENGSWMSRCISYWTQRECSITTLGEAVPPALDAPLWYSWSLFWSPKLNGQAKWRWLVVLLFVLAMQRS